MLGVLVFLAVCMIVLGLLVLFWLVMMNVMYGIYLHQLYVKEHLARRWPVQDYDPAKDAKDGDAEAPASNSQPEAKATAMAPAQEAMAKDLPGQTNILGKSA